MHTDRLAAGEAPQRFLEACTVPHLPHGVGQFAPGLSKLMGLILEGHDHLLGAASPAASRSARSHERCVVNLVDRVLQWEVTAR